MKAQLSVCPNAPLSKSEKRVFIAILRHMKKKYIVPSCEELGVSLKRHKLTVFDNVRHIEKKGYIRRESCRARSIVVLFVPEDIKRALRHTLDGVIDLIPLTLKQKKILEFIIRFIKRKGKSPILDEIAKHFRVTKITIHKHVFELERKRCITKEAGRPRSMNVLYHPPKKSTNSNNNSKRLKKRK